jgi:hypothetical protein
MVPALKVRWLDGGAGGERGGGRDRQRSVAITLGLTLRRDQQISI